MRMRIMSQIRLIVTVVEAHILLWTVLGVTPLSQIHLDLNLRNPLTPVVVTILKSFV